MKHWVKAGFMIVLACLLILALSACGKEDLTKVRVAEVTRSIFYAPQYVAIEKDFLKKKD